MTLKPLSQLQIDYVKLHAHRLAQRVIGQKKSSRDPQKKPNKIKKRPVDDLPLTQKSVNILLDEMDARLLLETGVSIAKVARMANTSSYYVLAWIVKLDPPLVIPQPVPARHPNKPKSEEVKQLEAVSRLEDCNAQSRLENDGLSKTKIMRLAHTKSSRTMIWIANHVFADIEDRAYHLPIEPNFTKKLANVERILRNNGYTDHAKKLFDLMQHLKIST